MLERIYQQNPNGVTREALAPSGRRLASSGLEMRLPVSG